ncbi:cupin domain-containing protein [Rhizobium tubonense]|jgi:quercetin dioxygenase-like cupin family protein|uniref:Cupin n=1 Tax=Rhizobium tubonense TaxID=484088 RepID=A0A2W4D554_9HYPH|nr:cupin domain-containing protein [Rhizobium tubonense]PZM17175.1 cupin [Rhizobium tubonense]
MMSNSNTATEASTTKSVFVLADHVERRARLEGTWLNIFDVTVSPGGGTPLHSHASPEVFRILEGSLTIQRMSDSGLQEVEAIAGDIVSIPAHVPHGYSNPGPAPCVFSAIVDKEMAVYFEAADSSKPTDGTPDDEAAEQMIVAANAHGIHILAA